MCGNVVLSEGLNHISFWLAQLKQSLGFSSRFRMLEHFLQRCCGEWQFCYFLCYFLCFVPGEASYPVWQRVLKIVSLARAAQT
jgi:hypothetical protein